MWERHNDGRTVYRVLCFAGGNQRAECLAVVADGVGIVAIFNKLTKGKNQWIKSIAPSESNVMRGVQRVGIYTKLSEKAVQKGARWI